MKEEYLHYIFRTKQLGKNFTTTKNLNVEILNFGLFNTNAGPDFLECKIKLNGKIWAGQIEFHVKSSDWIKHKHQNDPNYNNVILHMVFEHDLEITSGQYELPVVELKNVISQSHYLKYKTYMNSKNWIACQNDIQSVDDFIIFQQKEKALLNRLSRKSKSIINLFEHYNGDRKKVFYIVLFKAFGTKVNQQAFKKLGENFDHKVIAKLNYDLVKIQAYLFGISGFLTEKNEDKYFLNLQKEYAYQKQLYSLTEMNIKEWKFSTMRPSNFPTVRIAQISQLLSNNLKVNENQTMTELIQIFKTKTDDYWERYYMFGRVGKRKNKGLSLDFINLILINVVIPYLFAIGCATDDEKLKEKTFDWLEQIKPEKNALLNKWKKMDIEIKTVADSQALIELKNEFCSKHKCLNCKIGQYLLKFKGH